MNFHYVMEKMKAYMDYGTDLSVITISKDLKSLCRLLNSIDQSNHNLKLEVLCAYSGDRIEKNLNFPFEINYIKSHNFAKNNNELANKAKGDVLLFLNDHIILDQNSLQRSWNAFQRDNVGILGINLRYPNRKIQHSGIYFRKNGLPYHRFQHKLDFDDKRLTSNRIVPAVSGDFLMIDKKEFLKLKFDEKFQKTGEDIFLCLQYQKLFNKDILYVGDATAINESVSTTNSITSPEDLKKIKIAYNCCKEKINSIMDDYKVRIITEPPPGWILYRLASEIKLKNVLINEDMPDADIHYYINYFLFNEKPLNGITVGNFTHYDPNLHDEKFIQAAKEMDYCISISEETTKIMKSLEIDEEKISTVIIGADKSFKPKLTLGIIGTIKTSGRKGENLVQELLEDKQLMQDMQIVSLNDCWESLGIPIWNMEHQDFYRSIDYLLVPSLIEGGPVPFMEALASGTLAIAPPIGVIPQFPHIEYETGNIISLKDTIKTVKNDFLDRKQKIAKYMKDYNWDTWAYNHDKIFKELLFDLDEQ